MNKIEEEKITKKSNKGITLIALVITIIVLLILAGISIATLTRTKWIVITGRWGKNRNWYGESKREDTIRGVAEVMEKMEH